MSTTTELMLQIAWWVHYGIPIIALTLCALYLIGWIAIQYIRGLWRRLR